MEGTIGPGSDRLSREPCVARPIRVKAEKFQPYSFSAKDQKRLFALAH